MKKLLKRLAKSLALISIGGIITIVALGYLAYQNDFHSKNTIEALKLKETVRLLQENYIDSEQVEDDNLEYLYQVAAQAIFKAIGDEHGGALNEKATNILRKDLLQKSYVGVGVVIQPFETNAVKGALITKIHRDSPLRDIGIEAGDLITEVDGVPYGSDIFAYSNAISDGPEGTSVVLRIKQDIYKDLGNIQVERKRLIPQTVYHKMFDCVLLIRVERFSDRTPNEVYDVMQGAAEACDPLRGVILDLRSNPGGLLDSGLDTADLYLKKDRIIVEVRGRNDAKKVYRSKDDPVIPESTPMITLVNGYSASASEIVAGAVWGHNVSILMGRKTFGKGSVQTLFPLPNGSSAKITVARYFPGGNMEIDGKGITPLYKTYQPFAYEGSNESERRLKLIQVRDTMDPKQDAQLAEALKAMEVLIKDGDLMNYDEPEAPDERPDTSPVRCPGPGCADRHHQYGGR